METQTGAQPYFRTSIPVLALKSYAPIGAVMVLAIAALGGAMATLGTRDEVPDLTAAAAFVALAPASTIAGRLFAALTGRLPTLREAGTFGLVSAIAASALAFLASAAMRWFGAKAWLLAFWTQALGGEAQSSAFGLALVANAVIVLMAAWSFWSTARRLLPPAAGER